MLNQISHDRLVAKLQRFADTIHQRKLEKETLSITLGRCLEQADLQIEILIYEEIIEEYHEMFKDILYR